MPLNLPGITYPFDPTGQLPSNRVSGEEHIITTSNFRDYHFVVPTMGPFFATGFIITHRNLQGVVTTLQEGIDFQFTHWFLGASRACSTPVYGSISFMNLQLAGVVTLGYQTIGGDWTLNQTKIAEILADRIHNPRITTYEQVSGKPNVFPVVDHEWNLTDMVGATELVEAIREITGAVRDSLTTGFAAHVLAVNPHGTTAHDVDAYTRAEIDAMIGSPPHFNTADEIMFMGGL